MKKFLVRWLGFSLVVHLLAAIFTQGYYDFDEHFQILEFMNQRILGLHSGDGKNLAWEFHAQMRPWLQPFFYEAFARILLALGDRDPGHWVLLFRLISALLGWLSMVGLALCSLRWFEKVEWQKNAIRFLCLFWYLPFLHARTSSENFSGTFFWLGFSGLMLFVGTQPLPQGQGFSLLKQHPRLRVFKEFLFLGIGLCFGFAFEFRYQMAIAVFGAFSWLGWRTSRDHRLLSAFFWMTTGLGLACILGTGLDFLGYEKIVFAPYQYFYQNILLHRAAEVGVSPAHYYLLDLAAFTPPLGFLATAGVLLSWLLLPGHPLNWITLPYILVHSAIAHKEQRFLYPVWPVFPILAALALAQLEIRAARVWRRYAKLLRGLGWVVATISSVMMFYLALKPITARPGFYLTVYRHVPEIKQLYYIGTNPYQYGSGLVFNFYKKPELKLINVKTPADLPSQGEFWLFHDQFELPQNLMALKSCHLEYTVFPQWLKAFTIFAGPARFASRWSLFRCQ